jgi:hypothetical protein
MVSAGMISMAGIVAAQVIDLLTKKVRFHAGSMESPYIFNHFRRSLMSTPTILLTSLAEIRSFHPCTSGWKAILSAHPHETEEDFQRQFPLVECLESNSISDVCWLLGKRKTEIQICVRFAGMCADSVKHLKNNNAAAYATSAADAAAAADATSAVSSTIAAADAAAIAAADAAAYAAYAAYATYATYDKQRELNKSFLLKCINEFNKGE